MRFVSYLVSLTLIGLCSTRAMGQTVEPGQKDGTAKESEIWEGRFADGTPLTQEKLEALLASHLAWVQTADQKLKEEWGKAKVKQDRETWTRELLASDWEANQGRLVLKGGTKAGEREPEGGRPVVRESGGQTWATRT